MNTLYLGKEEVDAYLKDLAERLQTSVKRPTIWFPIGRSGEVLVERLLRQFPALSEGTYINRVNFDRKTAQSSFTDGQPDEVCGKHVLVIDSSVHSGSTMARVVKDVSGYKPASICSYTLVLKRSSTFIPSLWGVMINDHDRAYFLLDQLPNNRLHKHDHTTHIRRLTKDDFKLPAVTSGLESIDRVAWADRYYDMVCSEHERRTYLLEQADGVIGYLTVSRVGGKSYRVDEVVVGKNHQGNGHAGTLLRYAETCTRQIGCEQTELWAIEEKVPMYEHSGYNHVKGADPMDLDGEKYHLMRKRLIHHV